MSVQRAILPGILFGIFSIIGLTSLLTTHNALAAGNDPADVQEAGISAPAPSNAQVVEGCSISPSYPDSIQQWCGLITQYASRHGLDPNLVSAVMLRESAGKPDAYSKSGAVGLMQVMPRDGKAAGFMCKNGPCFATRPSSNELFDPEFNVEYGTQMLADLIGHYGDIREALKAYGPMDVGYYYADLIIGTMNEHR